MIGAPGGTDCTRRDDERVCGAPFALPFLTVRRQVDEGARSLVRARAGRAYGVILSRAGAAMRAR